MNEIGTRAVRCDGRFAGQFRRIHKAEWETVSRNGCPILFPSETEAKLAAWEALAASGHLTSLMRRDGWTVGESARAAAERLFTRKAADGADKISEIEIQARKAKDGMRKGAERTCIAIRHRS